MSTASRDSWEPPFKDSARGVTYSKIPPCGGEDSDSGLDKFGPLRSVTLYVLCGVGVYFLGSESDPFTCVSYFLFIVDRRLTEYSSANVNTCPKWGHPPAVNPLNPVRHRGQLSGPTLLIPGCAPRHPGVL